MDSCLPTEQRPLSSGNNKSPHMLVERDLGGCWERRAGRSKVRVVIRVHPVAQSASSSLECK